MNLNILNMSGDVVGNYNLKPEIFDIELNKILLKEVIEWQRNKARACSYATLTRGQLSYSTRKLRKQKGTGMARIGAKGAPHHRKGGVAHGPDGRNFIYSMPKKKVKKALFIALSQVFRDGNLIILDKLGMEQIKTKQFLASQKALNLNKKCLFVDTAGDENVLRSMRNVIGCDFLPLVGLNTLSVMKSNHLIITEEALKKMEEKYAK